MFPGIYEAQDSNSRAPLFRRFISDGHGDEGGIVTRQFLIGSHLERQIFCADPTETLGLQGGCRSRHGKIFLLGLDRIRGAG